MALTDENGGMNTTMLVSPTAGNGGFNSGFGGDNGWWIILLILLIAIGGWGNNGNGGWGNNGGFGASPVIVDNNGGSVQRGFDQAAIMGGINGVQTGVQNLSTQLCGCCSDIQNTLCNGFAGVNASINNGFAQSEIANNARQMANMQQMFGLSTQFADCCCENRLGTADLKYTIATENCADRAAISEGIRDILTNQTANTQRILDQLCADKIDAKNDEIATLRQQIAMKDLAASQIAQNAFIQHGFSNEVDQLYNRLNSCPVPTTPVYGRTPIFTCNNNNGCGCGCGM